LVGLAHTPPSNRGISKPITASKTVHADKSDVALAKLERIPDDVEVVVQGGFAFNVVTGEEIVCGG
jgi:hypothetical protein